MRSRRRGRRALIDRTSGNHGRQHLLRRLPFLLALLTEHRLRLGLQHHHDLGERHRGRVRHSGIKHVVELSCGRGTRAICRRIAERVGGVLLVRRHLRPMRAGRLHEPVRDGFVLADDVHDLLIGQDVEQRVIQRIPLRQDFVRHHDDRAAIQRIGALGERPRPRGRHAFLYLLPPGPETGLRIRDVPEHELREIGIAGGGAVGWRERQPVEHVLEPEVRDETQEVLRGIIAVGIRSDQPPHIAEQERLQLRNDRAGLCIRTFEVTVDQCLVLLRQFLDVVADVVERAGQVIRTGLESRIHLPCARRHDVMARRVAAEHADGQHADKPIGRLGDIAIRVEHGLVHEARRIAKAIREDGGLVFGLSEQCGIPRRQDTTVHGELAAGGGAEDVILEEPCPSVKIVVAQAVHEFIACLFELLFLRAAGGCGCGSGGVWCCWCLVTHLLLVFGFVVLLTDSADSFPAEPSTVRPLRAACKLDFLPMP